MDGTALAGIASMAGPHRWGGGGTIGDAGGPVASGRGGQPSPRIWRRLATGRSRMPHGTMRPKPCV